jgi:hypothetical protein
MTIPHDVLRAVARFTSLGFILNAELDAGKSLDIDETYAHISDGSLFPWLVDTLGIVQSWADADVAPMLDLFDRLSAGVGGATFDVDQNGLALLVAYCLEGVQQTLTW